MPTSWWIEASNFLILWREVLWIPVKLRWINPSAMKLTVTIRFLKTFETLTGSLLRASVTVLTVWTWKSLTLWPPDTE